MFKNYFLLAITIVILIIVSELLLWLKPLEDPYGHLKTMHRNYITYSRAENMVFYTESEEDLPGMSGHIGRYSTNNIGFRGNDYIEDKDQVSIFMIGGSTTEDLFIDDSLCVSSTLEKLLNKRSNQKFSVFNAGMSGTDTQDHIEMIALRIMHLNPDLIILYCGFNDLQRILQGKDFSNPLTKNVSAYFSLKMVLTEFQLYRRFLILKNNFKSWFSLHKDLSTITIKTRYKQLSNQMKMYDEDKLTTPINFSSFKTNINSIIGICNKNNVPIIIETHPTSWNSPFENNLKDWQWIRKVPQEEKSFVLDEVTADSLMEEVNDYTRSLNNYENKVFIHDLSKSIPKTTEYFVDDAHFNIKGSITHGTLLDSFINENIKNIFNE